MADLHTSFMGVQMSSPVVVGASSISQKIDNIKKAEDAGAGGLVIYSLFQEQIEIDTQELDEELALGSDVYSESLTYLPHLESAGPREHIMWTEKARKAVKFPLFGSLNATSPGNWLEYAKLLENAGCDGLELNLYSLETNPSKTGEEIEKQAIEVITSVKSAISIPVAVKLSPFYTSIANFASKVAGTGVDGMVLFNRFYQPTIDPDKQALSTELVLSSSDEMRLPMRWIAILSSQLDIDLASSTGVHSGWDVVRQLLAGAQAAQVVSALYRNGIGFISTMNWQISDWMDAKGYKSIDDFRGKLNQKHVSDPYAFERAQYIKLLLGHK